MPITRLLARRRALTIHHHQAPVNNLPIELLAEIFSIGLHHYRPDDHRAIKYLSTISSICATWRGAALGASSLWRRIVYTDHGDDPHKIHAISRHTKDRLIAYLSRSKSCGFFLHLRFGASSLKIQAIKRILQPHLSRCHSIWLSFMLETDMEDLFPLPGNLCRLTEFTCVSCTLNRSNFGSIERAPLPIFAEPERVSLRKLILKHCRLSLDGINVQDLRLTHIYPPWPKRLTFIPQCHSLTTLITPDFNLFDPEQPPFTLPNLTYLDTVGFTMLKVAHTPNLQTLALTDVDGDKFANTVVRLPSLPALTTLCVIFGDLSSEKIKRFLALNTGIMRIMLSDCDGTSDLVRLLKTDDAGSAANTLSTMLLPSLSLLQVCDSSIPDADGFHHLFACRPTLRIEHGETRGVGHFYGSELKETIEEFGQNSEPGVFKFRDFRRRIVVREDGNTELQTASADA